jgi:DNA-binding NarL/FixJ family response regulator
MIRLLIADDHAIVRDGLRRILEDDPDIIVAGEATNGFEALAKVRSTELDLLLLDLSMPGKNGIELIKQIKDELPKLPILVLTMHDEDQYAMRAIKSGASGYLTKDSASTQLISAVKRVAAGRLYISQNLAEELAMNIRPNHNSESPHTLLSDREFEVLQLLVKGKSVSEIGGMLFLSVKTVSTHKTRVLQKMNMTSIADLVRYAVSHKLVDDIPEG